MIRVGFPEVLAGAPTRTASVAPPPQPCMPCTPSPHLTVTAAVSVMRLTAAAATSGRVSSMRFTAALHPPHFMSPTSSSTVQLGAEGEGADGSSPPGGGLGGGATEPGGWGRGGAGGQRWGTVGAGRPAESDREAGAALDARRHHGVYSSSILTGMMCDSDRATRVLTPCTA